MNVGEGQDLSDSLMIHTIDLFEPLDNRLLDLLRTLSRDDWGRPTVAGRWTVREVVAHLLDTPLRRLSFVRDGFPPDGVSISSDADLVAFVNEMNAEGVRTYGRLSPAILIDLMALATRQLRDHLRATADDAPAAFPVSWAGESASAHWFDVAREYTERWHHQAQIRLAVDAVAPLMAAPLYAPVLATFVRALPYALRVVEVPARHAARGDDPWRGRRRVDRDATRRRRLRRTRGPVGAGHRRRRRSRALRGDRHHSCRRRVAALHEGPVPR